MIHLLVLIGLILILSLTFVLFNLTLQLIVFLGSFVGFIVIAFVLTVIVLNFVVMVIEKDKYSDVQRWKFIMWLVNWATPLLTFSKTEVEGLEKLDETRVARGVIYANHQSIVDVFSIVKSVKRRHAYIAKKEIGNIFLLSRAMRMIDCGFLDRQNPRAAVKTITEAVKVVKRGILMVIFPEGTREILAPMDTFKAGSFKVALKAQADIIPMTIYNSYEVIRRWPLPTTVRIKIHDPIPYDAYKDMETREIASMVEAIVKQDLL